MKNKIIIGLIVSLILAGTLIVYVSLPSVEEKVSRHDQIVEEQINEIRDKRDKALLPYDEEIQKLQDQIKLTEQLKQDELETYNKEINELKKLFSMQYKEKVEVACSEGQDRCEEMKKNILLPPAKAKTIDPIINKNDPVKLDKWFKSKHSPLNGYGWSFVEYAKKYKIDADFAVCVTWADSQSGKMLTTPNNWGNVGNNDRGDRIGYATPEEGIEAIYKVMTNRYLSNNNKIGEMSNGGRRVLGLPQSSAKNVFVYATSPVNWNNNVLHCMNEIKGVTVDENYQFRF